MKTLNMNNKILNLLGLAQRAGKIVSGDFVVEKTIQKEKVHLLILAKDCAANNTNKYRHLAERSRIPLRQVSTKDELGHALGKDVRAIVAVMDGGFAKALLQEIDE